MCRTFNSLNCCYSSSFKILIKFLFTCSRVLLSILPSLPIASSVSIVASFERRTTDSILSPFSFVGFKSTSVSSFHLSCVEIKANVTSISPLTRTSAGLFLLPDKSVKGNGISTISPFFICMFLSNLQQNTDPPRPLKNYK